MKIDIIVDSVALNHPNHCLFFLIDVLIYGFHTHFDQGLKARHFARHNVQKAGRIHAKEWPWPISLYSSLKKNVLCCIYNHICRMHSAASQLDCYSHPNLYRNDSDNFRSPSQPRSPCNLFLGVYSHARAECRICFRRIRYSHPTVSAH